MSVPSSHSCSHMHHCTWPCSLYFTPISPSPVPALTTRGCSPTGMLSVERQWLCDGQLSFLPLPYLSSFFMVISTLHILSGSKYTAPKTSQYTCSSTAASRCIFPPSRRGAVGRPPRRRHFGISSVGKSSSPQFTMPYRCPGRQIRGNVSVSSA